MKGIDLSRSFAADVVEPLLRQHFPDLPYATARLGSGSDVLGLDDETSRDHDWGCRLTLLLPAAEQDRVEAVRAFLEQELPEAYAGHPVRFPVTWNQSESHQVEVATVADFARSRLGARTPLTTKGWLTVTGQGVLEVTAGPVFTDTTGELAPLRESLRWYPDQVDRFVLATSWIRIGMRMSFIGRTAQRGQPLQSRIISSALAGDLMELSYLVHRKWAPYAKWREARLPARDELAPALNTLLTADDWRDRERAVLDAAELLLKVQRDYGRPGPETAAARFYDRPQWTIDEQVPFSLLAEVTDEGLRKLPYGMGSVGQWADCDSLLSNPDNRAELSVIYDNLTGGLTS
ncbi:MAG: DUF4037 domain-containing protein [Hamadaea sp.]|uniref:DUF4037 domain-containing protein n=1 Tax=Hamadaea sp. TaxID=2024425 RepID=UPI0017B1B356|nr:DUF4037 domain-containing protein [Hamadaea sp.]NUR73092.1 DUF4037 domain-containing protein [Hamadaea sp.]NUT23004.1 DUF4037 domain-containing protein [Hamadaea sp.]